jgi:hypothetical protein
MIRRSLRALKRRLDPEKVAYWYLLLNSFFKIENFVIHPDELDLHLERSLDSRGRANVHRALAAIGCIPPDRINEAAADIYRAGMHQSENGLGIRLVAIGRDRSGTSRRVMPK